MLRGKFLGEFFLFNRFVSVEVAAMLEKEGVSLADVEDMPIDTQ